MNIDKHITDTTTEEKIRNAARSLFHKKGFAATRTREIAEEAGINLALLNYYFRSKKKLFDIIMLESMKEFLLSLTDVVNDRKTSLERKIEILAGNYIDLLIEQPEIPLFVLSELRTNPEEFISRMNLKKFIMESYFFSQVKQNIAEGKIKSANPLHFFMNIMSLIVFPFISSPILLNLGDMKQDDFNTLMHQRKALIPLWIGAMMKAGSFTDSPNTYG
jgi:AcrR family transcriptional regulator